MGLLALGAACGTHSSSASDAEGVLASDAGTDGGTETDAGGSASGSDAGSSASGSDAGDSTSGSDAGGSASGSDAGSSASGSDAGDSASGSDAGGSASGSDAGGSASGSDAGGSASGSDAGSSASGSDAGTDGGGSTSSMIACDGGVCTGTCGDGWINSATEECDDGNTIDGDGCSSTCKIESGFACSTSMSTLPSALTLSVTFRDVKPYYDDGGHPDFERYACSDDTVITQGMVASTLGSDGKPYVSSTYDAGSCPMLTDGGSYFSSWYHDDPQFNTDISGVLTLTMVDGGTYTYNSVTSPLGYTGANLSGTYYIGFFPLDDAGFGNSHDPYDESGYCSSEDTSSFTCYSRHNYSFTTEIHYYFQYAGGETLTFSGDDDVWVFINNRLAIDLGGTHTRQVQSVTLSDSMASSLGGMVKGLIYEIDIFHAERHMVDSNFWLTLTDFEKGHSVCYSTDAGWDAGWDGGWDAGWDAGWIASEDAGWDAGGTVTQ